MSDNRRVFVNRRWVSTGLSVWQRAGCSCYGVGAMKKNGAHIGILTVSDRASEGTYEDRSGPAIRELLDAWLVSPWQPIARVTPDNAEEISRHLRELADELGCCLILTTGGTGPAPRDVTPEATESVCDRMMPGFGELMRTVSLREVPTAILSRQTAGLRGRTLIVNLPGSPRSIRPCLEAVFPAIPYCIDLMGGPYLQSDPARMPVFRPPHAAVPVNQGDS